MSAREQMPNKKEGVSIYEEKFSWGTHTRIAAANTFCSLVSFFCMQCSFTKNFVFL